LQSVLDEKSSKVVEVIISSVKPFQLMMGKVLGVGAVAFYSNFNLDNFWLSQYQPLRLPILVTMAQIQ
jgi:hypothetical protein